MATFNEILDELKAAIEAGFTLNGRKFLGTTPGDGVFTVSNFRGVETAFEVDINYSATDDVPLGPGIYMHEHEPSPNYMVGGRKNVYLLTVEIVFNEQCKTVNAVEIGDNRLARHFYQEFEDGINKIDSQMTTVNSIKSLGGQPQSGRVGTTNIYGATLQLEIKF